VASEYVRRIAKARGCTEEAARQFLLEVQALQKAPSSFQSIWLAVSESPPNASNEALAQKATEIHSRIQKPRPGKSRKPKKRKLRTFPSEQAKYVIVGGVVERLSSWQVREGIRKEK